MPFKDVVQWHISDTLSVRVITLHILMAPKSISWLCLMVDVGNLNLKPDYISSPTCEMIGGFKYS